MQARWCTGSIGKTTQSLVEISTLLHLRGRLIRSHVKHYLPIFLLRFERTSGTIFSARWRLLERTPSTLNPNPQTLTPQTLALFSEFQCKTVTQKTGFSTSERKCASLRSLILSPKKTFYRAARYKRLEEGYEPTKRPTRHTGDVPAPNPHERNAGKGNPHGVKPILY